MTKLASRERFLEIYAGVLTAVFAITVFGGFAESRKTAFDEIDVDRINIVEPDGTLQGRDRLVNQGGSQRLTEHSVSRPGRQSGEPASSADVDVGERALAGGEATHSASPYGARQAARKSGG
jgi:hypothetical protein